jgi:hypothetical protein
MADWRQEDANKMNDSTKTLIINTITEEKYLQLSVAGKISNN